MPNACWFGIVGDVERREQAAVTVRTRRLLSELDRVGSRQVEDRIAAFGEDGLLRLGGGPVRPLPAHVRDAVIAAFDEPLRRPSRGLAELRTAIAAEMDRQAEVRIDPEQEILVTNGAMQALNIVCRALLEPGDEVVIPTPNFFFDGIVRLPGGKPVYVPCSENEGWRWDLGRIEAALTPRTKIFVACNPTNPTGYLPTRADLEAICAMAERYRFVVLSDESYDRFVYDGARLTSLLELRARSSNLVLVRSLSKSHALAGWRMGFIAARADLIDSFVKVLEWECLHGAYVPQRAATAALEGPQDWLGNLASEYQAVRDRLWLTLSVSKWLPCVKPQAGPFFFINTRRAEEISHVDGSEMLLRAGLPTVPGRFFQSPGYVRLPFGVDEPTLRGMEQILSAFTPAGA
jgi:aminotransferase